MTQIQVFGMPMSLVTTTDAWYNKATYLRKAVKWDKRVGGWSKLTGKQIAVCTTFADIQTDANNKGLSRWQRRNLVAKVMRGKSFGGTPKAPSRSPVPNATVQSAISSAEAIIAGYIRRV